MTPSTSVTARSYYPGIGEAVADRTVNRRIFTEAQRGKIAKPLLLNPEDPFFKEWRVAADLSEWPVRESLKAKFRGELPELRSEIWAEVANRVAHGNTSLVPTAGPAEFQIMRDHLAQGSLLMSGRHLQHGDASQPERVAEVFTNCSTAAASFVLGYLLLNGSGVGRAYDDDLMLVDWAGKMPKVFVTIDDDHPDVRAGRVSTDVILRSHVEHLKGADGVTWFDIPDSRGGWAQGLERIETMAFQGRHKETLVLDYSDVRPYGSPIRGMQYRPSSGPATIMAAMISIAKLRGQKMAPWLATMYVDHYMAECVLVGGARRAARMATKTWRDPGIFEFISFKTRTGFWSSNNSVTIDAEFRERVTKVARHVQHIFGTNVRTPDTLRRFGEKLNSSGVIDAMDLFAWKVLVTLAAASYFDGTGEPGIINQDRLVANDAGIEAYVDGLYVGSRDFQPAEDTRELLIELAKRVVGLTYTMITNPCGEITLLMLGGYCVIADVVPFHARSDDDAEEAFRVAVRALIRTNTMDCLYSKEVERTNRIGVGMTGFHEWAYARFGFSWKDLVNEEASQALWQMVSRFKRAVVDEAARYAAELGVVAPHTNSTFKPAGTTSKLFGLTEGAHLPSRRWYLRWVQFRDDDPLVAEYAAKGYPTRTLTSYKNTIIVGFPTQPAICTLGDGLWVTTAAEATPEEQYQFLRLLEKYWIRGVQEDGVTPLATDTGNQVSYTLKYDPEVVDFTQFLQTLIDGQFSVRCCSVMPHVGSDATKYEYLPEEPVTKEIFDALVSRIQANVKEEVDFEHVDCASGACPVDFTARA